MSILTSIDLLDALCMPPGISLLSGIHSALVLFGPSALAVTLLLACVRHLSLCIIPCLFPLYSYFVISCVSIPMRTSGIQNNAYALF